MRISRGKLDLALARSCMNQVDLIRTTAIPERTIKWAFQGKRIRPATLGRIAKALNVDPAELIETEDCFE